MKIAVESDDGINIASHFNLLKNFMVFEVDCKGDLINLRVPESTRDRKKRLKLVRRISESKNIMNELSKCSTVISHCLNRPFVNNLRKSGVDVYITFKDKVDDALNQYFKDEFIHNFH